MFSVIRFDMRAPGLEPAEAQKLYAASLEMAEWADRQGFNMCVLSEHHAAPDGYLPSPLVLGAAVAARTRSIPIWVSALLIPLHDPVRLAEDIAVLDLISNGRVALVTGLGYRPVEYALLGQDWKRRGKRLDECLQIMIDAWTGKPIEVDGESVVVTPRPVQQPHPMVMVGGSSPVAAKRAARFGLGFFPPIGDQELGQIYRDECAARGIEPGWLGQPAGPGTLFVSEDPDRLWARIGPHLLHDATTYASWQPEGQRSHVSSHATTLEELRAEGVYQILTPDECVALADELGHAGSFTHHPMCGGTSPDDGWESLELYADQVLPRIRAAARTAG